MKNVLILLCVVFLVACNSESLSVKEATNLIETHTEKYPYFEKATFTLGERKLNLTKDASEVAALKQLAQEQLISLKDIETKKKLLSKDSIWIVNVALTAKASNFVVSQKKNKAEIKTYTFIIHENSNVGLVLNTKGKATATANLIKKPTPFAAFGKDANPHSDFISQTFTLKYKEKLGWVVTR